MGVLELRLAASRGDVLSLVIGVLARETELGDPVLVLLCGDAILLAVGAFEEPHLMAMPEFAAFIERPMPEFSRSHTWADSESEAEDDAMSGMEQSPYPGKILSYSKCCRFIPQSRLKQPHHLRSSCN